LGQTNQEKVWTGQGEKVIQKGSVKKGATVFKGTVSPTTQGEARMGGSQVSDGDQEKKRGKIHKQEKKKGISRENKSRKKRSEKREQSLGRWREPIKEPMDTLTKRATNGNRGTNIARNVQERDKEKQLPGNLAKTGKMQRRASPE